MARIGVWGAILYIVVSGFGAVAAPLPGSAVSLEQSLSPRCPGQLHAVYAFDPRIEWRKDSWYRLHLKVALVECEAAQGRWRTRQHHFADEVGAISFDHPWTQSAPQVRALIPPGTQLPAAMVTAEELRRWEQELQAAELRQGTAPAPNDRTTTLRRLQKSLGQTEGTDFLWLHFVTFDFDLNTILTAHDRQCLASSQGIPTKTGKLEFQLSQNASVSYQISFHLDQWAKMRVETLRSSQ